MKYILLVILIIECLIDIVNVLSVNLVDGKVYFRYLWNASVAMGMFFLTYWYWINMNKLP